MTKRKTFKTKLASAALVLCMAAAMLAGFLLALPARAYAASMLTVTTQEVFVSINLEYGSGQVGFSFESRVAGQSKIGVAPGGTVTIYDDKGNSYQYTFAGAASTGNYQPKPFKSAFTPALVYDASAEYYAVFSDGAMFVANTLNATADQGTPISGISLGERPAWLDANNGAVPSPTPSADAGTDEYYQRHYAYWSHVFAQLENLPDNGSLTVDTAGQDLDHIQHFVFDRLADTHRTLIINHKGAVYRINGGRMGSIQLGHNHLFVGNLDGYKTN